MGKKKKGASQPSIDVRLVYLNEEGRSEAYRMLAKIILTENSRS